MKRILLSSMIALAAIGAADAGTMTFTTNLATGTKVKILLNATSATTPVSIDWGNGVAVNYTVDPNQMAYNRWIEAAIEGSTIKISGNVTEATIQEVGLTSAKLENMSNLKDLDLSNNEIEDFEMIGVTPLKSVNLSHNKIQNSVYYNTTLCMENAAETLTNLNVAYNPGLICLDIRYLENLEYLSAYDCPDLGSVFICMPEDSRPNLRQISLQNCDLSHFYPVSLPGLRTLSLGNNKLMSGYSDDPFVLGDYPELTTLDVSNNPGITSLDITGCKKLESLSISNDRFSVLDVSQCPELITLSAANNNISTFDLGNNKQLKTINIAGNPVRELDLSVFPNLSSVNISDTQISRVMLMNAYYLQDFTASNTNIEFIDFNGQQAGRMRTIDIRNNKKMTGETMTYTLRTLPEAYGTAYSSGKLYIEGSNYEHAYTQIATDMDHHWEIDVPHGDGTALNTLTSVSVDADDTGRNVTGRLDRLYPHFGMGMDYDFDVYSTEGGEFLISQWQPVWFQSMKSVTDQAYVGVPIHIYPYPEEGKKFKSVTVNGVEIASQWFVISEPNTKIKVNFTSEENSISFTTAPGQTLSFLVNTTDYNGKIWIDWGTGTRTEYAGQTKYTSGTTQIGGNRIDGSAAGSTVTIYGDVAALDLSGFGDMAELFGLWDNAVTSIDLGNADNLKFLSLYWNPVKNIDLSGAPNLEILNVSYTDLDNLDLSHTPGLLWLEAYSDGWGEDGISMLKSIDVSNLPLLQYLEVKNNELTALDLSKNLRLRYLGAANNELSSIDVSKNVALEVLSLQGNNLSDIDVTSLTELYELTLDNNELTTVDVSKNTKLELLLVANNNIKALDTSKLSNLRRLYINGNGMTADELNDIYYLLPQRQHGPDDEEMGMGWNLAVIQGLDRIENDGTRADSSIALDRGWTPSHQGTNGGSDYAYLDIFSSPNGTLTVKDAAGNEYGHGSKVPKYTEMTITATPNEGYRLVSFTLNDEDPITGNTFTMPGIYTKLRPTFAKDSGIDGVNDGVGIIAGNGVLVVNAETATVDIFTISGQRIVTAAAVEGSQDFSLESGVYIVRVATANGAFNRKVIIK